MWSVGQVTREDLRESSENMNRQELPLERWARTHSHALGEMCPKRIVPFILNEKLLKGRNSSLFKSAFTQAVSCKLNSPGQDEFPHATWTRYLRAGASVVSSYKHWSCVQEGHCSLSKVTASATSYHQIISYNRYLQNLLSCQICNLFFC